MSVVVGLVIIAVVIMIVIVAVIVAEDDIVVDGGASGIDDLDVMQQPVERLALAQLRSEFADGIVALVGLAHLCRLLADLHRDALVFGLEVVVVDREVLGNGNGPQCEIDLDGLLRLHT
ncbi:unannotated protein [freshwater metagenome]|uniref:Unannotated protein n=1 Tax=freshwater metagenome TaxID=449393 RepID=A0A6J7F0T2_9ZZZZ